MLVKRKAFSLIEVIISVTILSFLGVAILNFNSFNKRAMENSLSKQQSVLISSPFLSVALESDDNKEYQIAELVEFSNLSDEDRKFLSNLSIRGRKVFYEKLFLYTDGEKDYFINYGDFEIFYNEQQKIPYIYLERP